MELLDMYLSYIKLYFQEVQWSVFFFMAQITQVLLCSGMTVWHKSKITVWEGHLFKQKFIYGSFGFVSTLRKKVFSGAPVKRIFLYGLNNSDSVVFGNAAFGEIKDHSVRTTSFQKRFLLEKFWICVYRT